MWRTKAAMRDENDAMQGSEQSRDGATVRSGPWLPSARRCIGAFFALGVVIPIGIVLVHAVWGAMIGDWSMYVWPTGFLLIVGPRSVWSALIGLTISILLNAVIYALVGACVWLAWWATCRFVGRR